MVASTYFDLLSDDTVIYIIFFARELPHLPNWISRYDIHDKEKDLLYTLSRVGGQLTHSTREFFDELAVGDIPNYQSIYDKNGTRPTGPYKRLYAGQPATAGPQLHRLITWTAQLNIRSLLLTPQASIPLLHTSFFPRCANTVVDLTLVDFRVTDGELVDPIFEYFGPRLESFTGGGSTPPVVAAAVHDHCLSLTSLKFEGLFCPLSSVGTWLYQYQLKSLALTHAPTLSQHDAELVRTKFRKLHELSIDPGDGASQEVCELVFNYFGGVPPDLLKHAKVGPMPAKLLAQLRRMYPDTTFDVRMNADFYEDIEEVSSVFEEGGSALSTVFLDAFFEFRDISRFHFADAAANCDFIGQLKVRCPLECPMRHLKKIEVFLPSFEPTKITKYLNFIASASGVLEIFQFEGKEPSNPKVWTKIATANPGLDEVRIEMTTDENIEKYACDLLEAFEECDELLALNCRVTRPELSTPLSPETCPRFRAVQNRYRFLRTYVYISEFYVNVYEQEWGVKYRGQAIIGAGLESLKLRHDQLTYPDDA